MGKTVVNGMDSVAKRTDSGFRQNRHNEFVGDILYTNERKHQPFTKQSGCVWLSALPSGRAAGNGGLVSERIHVIGVTHVYTIVL